MAPMMDGIPVPLYYKLKHALLSMIENEELTPDQLIPSERVLMDEHKVSRTTVRKAIDELVNEGYLYKQQGKGTFVRGKRFAQGLINLTSCTESLRAQGFDPHPEVLDSGVIVPKKVICHNLHLKEDEKVFYTQRVFYGDELPINCTYSYIPYKYVPGIEKHNFAVDSIYNAIENEYGIRIIRADRTIEAVLSTEQAARPLNTDKTSPLLKFVGWVYAEIDGTEKLIEHFITYYRSDRSKFFIEQVRG